MKGKVNNPTISENYFVLNTGQRIPAVGLGTWQADGNMCTEAVRAALKVGYRHFDCAHLYGNEVEVGQALKEALNGGIPGLRRDDIFVTSKLWCTTNAPKRVETSLRVCLKNLGLTYLDLYLVHWPVSFSFGDATDPPRKPGGEWKTMRLKATWQAMECLVEKGLVSAIGVSNFSVQQIQELLSFAKIVPAVNQVELHPLWRQDELLKFCQSKGIHVSAHTPLGVPAGNPLNDCGSSGEEECETPRIVFRRCRSVHLPMLKSSIISGIAARLHKTPEQVILRWGLQRGTSVLPRSLKPDRIKTNFDIFNWTLSEDDWKKINSLEPQYRLIDSGYPSMGEARSLQAVQEIDDE
eukprot:TRINITY_DN21023_c0_g1_i1.p1 TRINITY_DN21023_c0_g1~~TRINITY_DN21023_c0_g1_i1.p1  ORF type:complete len:352 (+),score=55.96 TRINITY_DN21023_c0_g1_i1:518-1573(+)